MPAATSVQPLGGCGTFRVIANDAGSEVFTDVVFADE